MNHAAIGRAIPPEKGGSDWSRQSRQTVCYYNRQINAGALSELPQKPNSRLGCQAPSEVWPLQKLCAIPGRALYGNYFQTQLSQVSSQGIGIKAGPNSVPSTGVRQLKVQLVTGRHAAPGSAESDASRG